MDLFELLKALILGFVEGMTEFAPVSSTGHLIIVDDMWLKSQEFLGKYPANTFKIVIQLGSILAVVVVFWKRLFSLVGLYKIDGKKMNDRFNLMHVIVGMLPAVVLGFAFKDLIDDYLFRVETVISALVVGAILMIGADKLGPKNPKVNSLDQITLPTSVYGRACSVFLIVARVFPFRCDNFRWCFIWHEPPNSSGFYVHHGCSNYDWGKSRFGFKELGTIWRWIIYRFMLSVS